MKVDTYPIEMGIPHPRHAEVAKKELEKITKTFASMKSGQSFVCRASSRGIAISLAVQLEIPIETELIPGPGGPEFCRVWRTL